MLAQELLKQKEPKEPKGRKRKAPEAEELELETDEQVCVLEACVELYRVV